MSEPLIVKASEWNDAQLKQQQPVRDERLIKDLPDTFNKILAKADLAAAADSMEQNEYSEEVATLSSGLSIHFVMLYMHKVIAAIAQAEPSEELTKHKQVVKKEFSKLEFLFVSKFHSLMEEICQAVMMGLDAIANTERQALLMVHNFAQIKTDQCLAPYLITDTAGNHTFVQGKQFHDYFKSLLQFVQHAVTLYKSAQTHNDITAHASQCILGDNVEQKKLVCNVLEAIANVKNGFGDGEWAVVSECWKTQFPRLFNGAQSTQMWSP